jgi:TetR/AcrR family transcriptional regulator, cholesterol catabolism regulator
MKQPGRRAQAHAEKRRRITSAAAELFRAQGFDETTTEQIAARADVAKGTLFLYAPSKVGLLLLVYEDRLEEIVTEVIGAVPQGAPVVDALCGIFTPFFALYEQDLDLARRFVREQILLTSETQPNHALAALMGALAHQIAVWQSQGRVAADIDARLAAQTSFALYFAVLAAWLGGRIPPEQRDAHLRASLALHWRGLTGTDTDH